MVGSVIGPIERDIQFTRANFKNQGRITTNERSPSRLQLFILLQVPENIHARILSHMAGSDDSQHMHPGYLEKGDTQEEAT